MAQTKDYCKISMNLNLNLNVDVPRSFDTPISLQCLSSLVLKQLTVVLQVMYMLWQIVPMRNNFVAEEVLPDVPSCCGSDKLHTVSSEYADCRSLLEDC